MQKDYIQSVVEGGDDERMVTGRTLIKAPIGPRKRLSGSPKAPSLSWKTFHACSLILPTPMAIMAQALLYHALRTDKAADCKGSLRARLVDASITNDVKEKPF